MFPNMSLTQAELQHLMPCEKIKTRLDRDSLTSLVTPESLYLPLTTEQVYVFASTPAFVALPVCVQDYSKTSAWIGMKCCVSTDVGCRDMDELTNF